MSNHPTTFHFSHGASISLAGLALAAGPGVAAAATSSFQANLSELNNSGASAQVNLTVDDVAQTLEVQYNATGLEAGKPHPGHIHGLFQAGLGATSSSPAIDSQSPTIAQDQAGDNDGFIEVAEGQMTYGPVLLPLTTAPGNKVFPTADASGDINYDVTFDLSDNTVFEDDLNPSFPVTEQNLFPLDLREVVLHGLTLDQGDGAASNIPIDEADGTAGYKAVLPVASGELFAVPTPTAAIAGLGMLGGLVLRRRRRRAA